MKLKKRWIVLIIAAWFISGCLISLGTIHVQRMLEVKALMDSLSTEDKKLLDRIEIANDIKSVRVYYLTDGTVITDTFTEVSENTYTK